MFILPLCRFSFVSFHYCLLLFYTLIWVIVFCIFMKQWLSQCQADLLSNQKFLKLNKNECFFFFPSQQGYHYIELMSYIIQTLFVQIFFFEMKIHQNRQGCIWQLCSDEGTEANLILRKPVAYKIYAIK